MTTTVRSRVRKGVREGGQFSTEMKSEDSKVGLGNNARLTGYLTNSLRALEEQFPGLLIDAQQDPANRKSIQLGYFSVDEDEHTEQGLNVLQKVSAHFGFTEITVSDPEDVFPDLDPAEANERLNNLGFVRTGVGESRRWSPQPSEPERPEPRPEPGPAKKAEPPAKKGRPRSTAKQPAPKEPAAKPQAEPQNGKSTARQAKPAIAFTPETYDGSQPVPHQWVAEATAAFNKSNLPNEPATPQLATKIGDLVSKRAHHLAGITGDEVKADWTARSEDLRRQMKEVLAGERDYSDVDAHQANLVFSGRDQQTLNSMRKLSDGYITALREIRPMGGEVKFHEDSAKKPMELINEAAAYYPTDWIRDINTKGHSLLAKKTSGRAGYMNSTYAKSKKATTDRYFIPSGQEMREDDLYRTYKLSENQEQFRGYNPSASGTYYDVTRYEAKPVDGYYKKTKTGAPYGGGWEKYEYNGREYWRRPRKRTTVDYEQRVSQVTVGGNRPKYMAGMSQDLDVAIHELGHRHGYHVEGLHQHEAAYRDSRTTLETGRLQPLERMYPRSKEFTRPDHFANRYMGRIYDHDATEVLTMGMESVFTGTEGGLIGIGGKPEDPDMRNFILGTLAIVPGNSESPVVNATA